MDQEITRRDFLNAAAMGTGAALLGAAAPAARSASGPAGPVPGSVPAGRASEDDWTGYAGVGDYAASNGNTHEVATAGHGLRDGVYNPAAAQDTGELYDLVIVGGGYAGNVAAYTFLKETGRRKTCLILENHPLMGGEAKRNEFNVRGHRLVGPQGSNQTAVPAAGLMNEIWNDVGLPRQFEFAAWPEARRPLEFPYDNYVYLLRADQFESHGFYFETPQPRWVTNPWGHGLEGTPWNPTQRAEMLRWRDGRCMPFQGTEEELRRWLDTMTYDEFLTKHRKLDAEVARYVDPVCAAGLGLGSDVISANAAYFFAFPGFQGLSRSKPIIEIKDRRLANARWIFSFPGGNDGMMRGLLKWLNPSMIEGSSRFEELYLGRLRPDRMDQAQSPCRMRTGSTVFKVMNDPERAKEPAVVLYAKGGKLHSLRARAVIWAAASWTASRAFARLPEDYRRAVSQFPRAPMLVANVALDNWRFLEKLGYTAFQWREGGFGYSANIVAPMYVGDYRPVLDPDRPIILTFYVPFNERGMSLVDQGKNARVRLLGTSYRGYELQIRRQMTKLFAGTGFDAQRDIAGIVLNRWGHAYVTAGPGFFYGQNGAPAPSDVLRSPLGNISFAHSELSGHQYAEAAATEGQRAARQMLAFVS